MKRNERLKRMSATPRLHHSELLIIYIYSLEVATRLQRTYILGASSQVSLDDDLIHSSRPPGVGLLV